MKVVTNYRKWNNNNSPMTVKKRKEIREGFINVKLMKGYVLAA
jgi:hypothetical protein